MPEFEKLFGLAAEARARAPGRVNMLGEHTDYNNGFVLPTPLRESTEVSIARSRDLESHVHSAQFAPGSSTAVPDFARYVLGCLEVLRERGLTIPPTAFYVDSQVPIGAGLSSSAALEVATLRALRLRYELPLDDVQIAFVAQEAEVRFAGVNCGIMDQMASSLGKTGKLLFLDTRNLSRSLIPLPAGSSFVVIDSGTSRELGATAYNTRRRECEQAAAALGVKSLRDVDDMAIIERLPAPLRQRARHVLTENGRVLSAAGGVTAAVFGSLMDASHASLKDDYEVTVPALDVLTACLQEHPSVYGARMTGAGFGGACVALVREGSEEKVASDVLAEFGARGFHGKKLVGL